MAAERNQSGESKPTDENPRIAAAVERYRQLLQSKPDLECDVVLDASLPDEQRSAMLRRLLFEERKSRKKANLSTSFETYFDRVWFDKCIDDLVSVILDRDYIIDARLGAGGQGRVYRVRNKSVHGRKEAMKIFLPSDPQFLKEFDNEEYISLQNRFDRESEALSKLRIDHLPTVHAVGDEDGLRYFTMEYIDGSSLAKLVEQRGALDPKEVVNWMITVAEALCQLHDDKILHRDLKPSNLILNDRGKLLMVDFGLVKLMPGAKPGTTTFKNDGNLTQSQGYGSRGYVSPEQAENAANVTPATDIYSLGATFFHLLNGFPFSGGITGPVRWMPHIPETLREICIDCLNIDPKKRPTAKQVERRLREWKLKSQTAVIDNEKSIKQPTRRRWMTISAGVALTAGVGYWISQREPNYRMDAITARAGELRDNYFKILFECWDEQSGWIRQSTQPNAMITNEVYTLAQVLTAYLSMPNIDDRLLNEFGKALRLPFTSDDLFARIQRNRIKQNPVGWLSRDVRANFVFADPILWLLQAQSKFRKVSMNRTIASELREAIQSDFQTTCQMLPAYYSEIRSGWYFFPEPISKDSYSNWTSILALQTLNEMQLAGQQLPANSICDGKLTDALTRTLKFLADRYDRDRPNRGYWIASLDQRSVNETDRDMSMRVFATIWLVLNESNVTIPTASFSEWERLAQELALSQADRSMEDLGPFIQFTATAPDLNGKVSELKVSNHSLWYPYAILLTYGLVRQGERNNRPESQQRLLRNLLGRLIIQRGEAAFESAKKHAFVYPLAENLWALAKIASS